MDQDWTDIAKQTLDGVLSTGVAEDILYRKHASLPWVKIRGVFQAQHRSVDPSTGEFHTVNLPTVTISDSDVENGPEVGDEIMARGKKYRADRPPERDGQEAGSSLVLKRLE